VQQAGEIDRAVDQISADKVRADRRGVAGGEDEVKHLQDSAHPLGELVR